MYSNIPKRLSVIRQQKDYKTEKTRSLYLSNVRFQHFHSAMFLADIKLYITFVSINSTASFGTVLLYKIYIYTYTQTSDCLVFMWSSGVRCSMTW